MRKNVVFTITGSDRPGIVDAVTDVLLQHEGNVESSRMSRLGGEFAMLLLVSLPPEQFDNLDRIVNVLVNMGFKVLTSSTERSYGKRYPGWKPYRIEVQGADHEGIIHQVAHYLSKQGINIESMDTKVIPAPMSGYPVFTMSALVYVPPALQDYDWIDEFEDESNQLDVDITVAEESG
jgi:glycine cleavage system transcriptional repressor